MAELAPESTAPEAPAFDMEGALGEIESGLGNELDPPEPDEAPPDDTPAAAPAQEAKPDATTGTTPSPSAPAAAAPNPALEKAPEHWKPEAAAEWAAVPPAVRAAVFEHQAQTLKFVEDIKPYLTIADNFNATIRPYAQVMADHNVNPVEHVSKLLAAHATIAFGQPEDKVRLLQALIREAGIDSAKLVAGDPTPYDPNQQAQARELATLKSQFSAVVQEVSASRMQSMEAEIEKFAGDPANKYFEELLPTMTKLMGANPNQSLKSCYEAAILASPVVRAKEIDRLTAERSAQVAKEAKAKAGAVRRATSTNVQSRSTGAARTAAGDWESDLSNILADVRSRQE